MTFPALNMMDLIQRAGKVAVLMGGRSAEREISLLSGNAVLAALLSSGVHAYAFDPSQRAVTELLTDRAGCAFIALHGRGGEDGVIQGALQTLGIAYTGSGVMASSLCLDKWRTKLVWQATQVPTAESVMIEVAEDLPRAARLGFPLMLKPVHEGSTIGIQKVMHADALAGAYPSARQHDALVLAERFVHGQELTVAVLDGVALPLVRIEAPQGNYDYQNKYFSDDTRYHCPAGIAADLEQRIKADALRAFHALGCHGWARADMILQSDGSYMFLEMNTVPGMTAHSLVPMAARAIGMDFAELCCRILHSAHTERQT